MGSKIEIKQLSKMFIDKKGIKTEALLDINLVVNANDLVCVVGPSGCGKSTLLRITAGLEKPSSGEVYLESHKVEAPGSERGLVFQEFALFPWRTVVGNIAFGPEVLGTPKAQRQKTIDELIKLVKLEGCKHKYPAELSGGMKQRVAIARALANNPEVLLMDEPFGALDAQTRNSMQLELIRIWDATQKTIIFVTHSVDEAVYLANKIVVMTARPGKIKMIMEINLKHPRDRTSNDFNAYRREILNSILQESDISV